MFVKLLGHQISLSPCVLLCLILRMVRHRNPSMVESDSDDDALEINEDTPPRSRSKRGRGSGNVLPGGETSRSHGAHGRTTRNPSGRSRPTANPQAWEATSDDEGGKDDDVDLPPANAPIIQGLVLHRAQARRSANEQVIDFTASEGFALLQDMRFQNPTFRVRDVRIDGNRFWTLLHVDFYNSVILPKKHQPILHQRFINWDGCEAIGDPGMTQALRAYERKRMKTIMTFQYDWNDEVIAQFYSTLWIKHVDEESPYNFPYLNFFIEGSWYKVSYRRFAHILDLLMRISQETKSRFMTFVLPPRMKPRIFTSLSLMNISLKEAGIR
jgi:hypothetical protein